MSTGGACYGHVCGHTIVRFGNSGYRSYVRTQAPGPTERARMTSGTPARGSAVASRAAEGGRASRKIVTVLFMDVIDSTVLADSLDPEAYRALMARYFAEATELITHHGGFVEKFIGDAVMAVFGVPP